MVDGLVQHFKPISFVLAISDEDVGIFPWNVGLVEEGLMGEVADQ